MHKNNHKKNKYLTVAECWAIVQKLLNIFENIESIADAIGCSHTTLYRYGQQSVKKPDARIGLELKELAIKHGILKT